MGPGPRRNSPNPGRRAPSSRGPGRGPRSNSACGPRSLGSPVSRPMARSPRGPFPRPPNPGPGPSRRRSRIPGPEPSPAASRGKGLGADAAFASRTSGAPGADAASDRLPASGAMRRGRSPCARFWRRSAWTWLNSSSEIFPSRFTSRSENSRRGRPGPRGSCVAPPSGVGWATLLTPSNEALVRIEATMSLIFMAVLCFAGKSVGWLRGLPRLFSIRLMFASSGRCPAVLVAPKEATAM